MPSTFPPERLDLTDSHTGVPVIQWTRGPSRNQHLYFTSPSVTADNKWLVFLSDREGHPNLYAIHRASGKIHALSENRSGLLRSYVYPDGGLSGLSKASPCLDASRNRIYYVRDDNVYAVDLDDPEPGERLICAMPRGWYGAFTHISPDGNTFCMPCTDPRAFLDAAATQYDQLSRVPPRMEREGLVSHIYLVDVSTGESRIAAEVPFWVTHVQFDPAGTGRIVFNLEGLEEGTRRPLPNRIWCLETSGHFHPLFPEASDEWRSHENWAADGHGIVYHGCRNGRPFVAARSWDGQLLREFDMPGIAVHHTTGVPDGRRFYADCHNGFIAMIDPDSPENPVTNLCRHDTSIEYQDAHAHPIATPDGGGLVFTSDRAGNCNVYEIPLSSSRGKKTQGAFCQDGQGRRARIR